MLGTGREAARGRVAVEAESVVMHVCCRGDMWEVGGVTLIAPMGGWCWGLVLLLSGLVGVL